MLGETPIILSKVNFQLTFLVLTCKSVTMSLGSNWVAVLTNALLLAKTDPGVLFFLVLWPSHNVTACLISCSYSSEQTTGPFTEMWRRLSSILFERCVLFDPLYGTSTALRPSICYWQAQNCFCKCTEEREKSCLLYTSPSPRDA